MIMLGAPGEVSIPMTCKWQWNFRGQAGNVMYYYGLTHQSLVLREHLYPSLVYDRRPSRANGGAIRVTQNLAIAKLVPGIANHFPVPRSVSPHTMSSSASRPGRKAESPTRSVGRP